MREEVRQIEGAEDFETGKPRATPLSYSLCWPQDRPARGLVFLIPGFGADAGSQYAAGLRRHVVERHGHVAVSVGYHCIAARPDLGARIAVDLGEQIRLVGLAQLYGLDIPDVNDLPALCEAFVGRPAPQVRATLTFPGGDLQNFGVVQALDHLRVLGDIMARGPDFPIGAVTAMGSSHGGYIAHLMAKIAPRSLAAVIDNSAYVQAPTAYAGGGQSPEWGTTLGGVKVWCRTARAFSYDDRAAPDFYGRDQDLIRDTGHPLHLAIQRAASGDGGTSFRMVRFDRAVALLYRRRQRVIVCGLMQFAAWSLGSVDIALALHFLGHPLPFVEAFMLEALIQGSASAAFAVPGALGVQEAGFLVFGAMLGLPHEIAAALAVMRRCRDLICYVPGLVVWQAHEGKRLLNDKR